MKKLILTRSLSAEGTIRRVFQQQALTIGTHVFGCLDDYSHGPLSPSTVIQKFFARRNEFWVSLDQSDIEDLNSIDLLEEHKAKMQLIQKAELIEFWSSPTVQEELFLIVTLHLLKLEGVNISNCRALWFDQRETKHGLGSLTVEQMSEFHSRTQSKPIDLDLYQEAWGVLSSGSPNALNQFILNNDPETPIVNAFSSLLLRYPEYNGGLGSIERALLAAGTNEMKKSAYTIGSAMGLGKPENDLIGDSILFKKLTDLGLAEHEPWFELKGDIRKMRGCSARITESGKKARQKFSIQAF